MKQLFSTAIFAAVFAAAAVASAHQPFFAKGTEISADTAFVIPDAEIARVVYKEVECPNTPLWLRLDAAAGTPLHLALGVPAIAALADFRPRLYLLGPGLSPPEPALPFELPAGLGALEIATAGAMAPPVYHDDFTDTDSWILAGRTEVLPADGTYYIVADSSLDVRGRLSVSIGTEELPGSEPNARVRLKLFFDGTTEPSLGQRCDDSRASTGAGDGVFDEDGVVPAGSGCACSFESPGRSHARAWLALGLVGLLAARRRRVRSRRTLRTLGRTTF
jgi:MYXO-CTERM domain-containing protein